MRIRAQLLLVAVAALLPAIVTSVLALDRLRENERQAGLRALKETVRATALIIDGEMRASMSALKALGSSRNLQNGDLKAFHEQAAAFNQLPDVWTVLYDSKGEQLVNTMLPSGTALPRPANAYALERTARVLATQRPLVTDLMIGSATGKMLTSLHVPAAAAGGQAYVLAQSFGVDYWKIKALQKGLPADWIVGIIDQHGKFIFRSRRSDELVGRPARPELVAAAAASDEGVIRHLTLDDREVYDAFAHTTLAGWAVAVAAPVKSIDGAANRAVQFALAGMLAAIAFTVFVVITFGQRLIGALVDTGRSAAALGQGHTPSIRRTGIVEIDQLNGALIDAGVLLDTERGGRRAAEAERGRLLANETLARQAAQAESFAKDQFMAMLGHELRNPLATISAATALLGKGGSSNADVERYVDMISRQSRHLHLIVNDLLDMSRLVAGKISLDREPLEMAECVKQCVETLRAIASVDGFHLAVLTGATWFSGDAMRMQQILDNLLSNALKFSEPGGYICVTVTEESGRVTVTVADEGAGIQTELLPRVFEPFVQGPPPARLAQHGGLGIGLALVRQLVRLHGGDVEVASAGPNQGSVFSFWVPAIAAPPVKPVFTELAHRAQRKLVYVEDNVDVRAMMAELLRIEGYDVVEVADGAGALPAVLASCPDLVLSDVGLPDITGYEVARRLRAHPLTKTVPLIALTGYGQVRDRNDAAQAGFDMHFAKPVDFDALFAAIEEMTATPVNSTPMLL